MILFGNFKHLKGISTDDSSLMPILVKKHLRINFEKIKSHRVNDTLFKFKNYTYKTFNYNEITIATIYKRNNMRIKIVYWNNQVLEYKIYDSKGNLSIFVHYDLF